LFHAPTTLVRLAECHLALGQLVLGTEELRRVTLEEPGPAPSRAFIAARLRARALLAAAEPRLGHLVVSVVGPEPGALSLHLDGEVLSAGMVGVDIPVDPGTHRVRAGATDFLPAERTVTAAEGARELVLLELAPAPVDPVTPARSDAPSAATEDRRPLGRIAPRLAEPVPGVSARALSPLRVGAIATLVAGVAGLGIGATFGVLALNDKARLDAVCVDQACPPSSRGDLAALQRDATISTIGWAVGGAAAAVSVLLFLLPEGRPGTSSWVRPAPGGLVAQW
jgi:hypothetical protein